MQAFEREGKGGFGRRETRGAREEGGREGNACQETIVFAIPPTNYVCRNNATLAFLSHLKLRFPSLSNACHAGYSDSGERCEVKKAMKSRGGLGREVRERCSQLFPPSPLPLPRFYFFALLFTSHRSPLSERLEQAVDCLKRHQAHVRLLQSKPCKMF